MNESFGTSDYRERTVENQSAANGQYANGSHNTVTMRMGDTQNGSEFDSASWQPPALRRTEHGGIFNRQSQMQQWQRWQEPISQGQMPQWQMNGGWQTFPSRDTLQWMLNKNIGHFCICEFLIGGQNIARKQGILDEVGMDYIVLYDDSSDSYTVCDLNSLKFLSFSDTSSAQMTQRRNNGSRQ